MSVRTFNAAKAAQMMAKVATAENIAKRLVMLGCEATGDGATDAGEIIRRSQATTQGRYAAEVLNVTYGVGGSVTAEDLTDCLKEAFPEAKVDSRHGPHYMVHARKGRLENLIPGTIVPFSPRRKAAPATATPTTEAAPATTPDVAVVEDPFDATSIPGMDRAALISALQRFGKSVKGKTEVLRERLTEATTTPDVVVTEAATA